MKIFGALSFTLVVVHHLEDGPTSSDIQDLIDPQLVWVSMQSVNQPLWWHRVQQEMRHDSLHGQVDEI